MNIQKYLEIFRNIQKYLYLTGDIVFVGVSGYDKIQVSSSTYNSTSRFHSCLSRYSPSTFHRKREGNSGFFYTIIQFWGKVLGKGFLFCQSKAHLECIPP